MEDMVPDWALPVLIAPFIGSFAAVLVERIPAGRGVIAGRSACAACGHVLGPADLVPILSWVMSRGRCRYCRAPIGWFHPAMELAALAAAVWAAAVVPGWALWPSCALAWTLLALAAMDQRHMVLADALTLPLAAAGVMVAYTIGPETLRDSAIGAVAGFAVFALIGRAYRALRGREGLGLGDAKLLAGAGAWLTWTGLPTVVAVAALGALAVTGARAAAGHRVGGGERLAFGPYLCAAVWLVWLYGPVAAG
jgi:leader peptidase (prepilin peptidase)/N-methyltransferase